MSTTQTFTAGQQATVTAPAGNGAQVAIAPGALRSAAMTAAEAYPVTDLQSHAQAIADTWEAVLKVQSKEYSRRLMAQSVGGPTAQAAGVISPGGYPWFDLLCAGPYQAGPLGAFVPQKVIRADQPAFILGALWRNPALIPPVGPFSAAQLMSGWNFTVWLETMNLTNVSNGPDFGPFNFAPIGAGNVNWVFAFLPGGTFPIPPSGRAHLYEINMTVDVTGPGAVVAGLPFSGFSTWLYDPDNELPFWMMPGTPPQFQHDVPMRFLIHS